MFFQSLKIQKFVKIEDNNKGLKILVKRVFIIIISIIIPQSLIIQ
jgi:hypothetical protein